MGSTAGPAIRRDIRRKGQAVPDLERRERELRLRPALEPAVTREAKRLAVGVQCRAGNPGTGLCRIEDIFAPNLLNVVAGVIELPTAFSVGIHAPQLLWVHDLRGKCLGRHLPARGRALHQRSAAEYKK
jgi:hypothetical protein